MLITESEITAVSRFEQDANASDLIVVTLPPIATVSRFSQPIKLCVSTIIRSVASSFLSWPSVTSVTPELLKLLG